MKRIADQRDGGGGKKNRNAADGYAEALAEGKFELRLLIPSKCAGAIIGRGGEKIKTIRDKVRINLFKISVLGLNKT
jgi:ribosomal protein S3